MKPHPYADIFPLLEGEEFTAFVANIRTKGLVHPIVLFEGMILDGRNRWNACKAAGVEPRFQEFDQVCEGDPLEFVVVTNLHRRHLTPSQCAMVGADLATMRQGARTDLGQPSASLPEVSQAQASKLATASERSVRSAVFVKKEGSRDLIQAVRAGKIAVSLAAKLATAPEAIQRRAVAEPERAHVLVKQERRVQREAELGARQLAWPTKICGVIYADPPWPWAAYSEITGMDRAPSYPTMDLDAIKALKVQSIAAPDSVLFLWATVPTHMQAGEVMAAWGFTYQTQFVWLKKIREGEKNRPGTGYWSRNVHETLLVGTRGKIPAPAPGTQQDSVIDAPVGEHSAKPEVFAEMIERHFPTLPKIELFARKAREGWARWGFEAPID
jgi:N6-adenosine-specific RNA methylase IME4